MTHYGGGFHPADIQHPFGHGGHKVHCVYRGRAGEAVARQIYSYHTIVTAQIFVHFFPDVHSLKIAVEQQNGLFSLLGILYMCGNICGCSKKLHLIVIWVCKGITFSIIFVF